MDEERLNETPFSEANISCRSTYTSSLEYNVNIYTDTAFLEGGGDGFLIICYCIHNFSK